MKVSLHFLPPFSWPGVRLPEATSPAHWPQQIRARRPPDPGRANPILPGKSVIETERQPDSWTAFLSSGNVNGGAVGWKVSNSTGMKGRQSVWRKRKTERARLAEEADSRDHGISSGKMGQARGWVLEWLPLRP